MVVTFRQGGGRRVEQRGLGREAARSLEGSRAAVGGGSHGRLRGCLGSSPLHPSSGRHRGGGGGYPRGELPPQADAGGEEAGGGRGGEEEDDKKMKESLERARLIVERGTRKRKKKKKKKLPRTSSFSRGARAWVSGHYAKALCLPVLRRFDRTYVSMRQSWRFLEFFLIFYEKVASDPVVDSQLPEEYRILLDSLGDDIRNLLVHSAVFARQWIHALVSVCCVYAEFHVFLREGVLEVDACPALWRVWRVCTVDAYFSAWYPPVAGSVIVSPQEYSVVDLLAG